MKINQYNDKYNICGEYFKKVREAQNLSQDDLSAKLSLVGVTLYKNDIYRIENNKRTVRDYELAAISDILNIDLNEFKKIIKK